MAEFLTWTERETNAGPGRIGLSDTALTVGTDPVDMPDFIDSTTYALVAPFIDQGSPEAELAVSRSFEETAYRVALSNGEFGASPSGFTMAVSCSLAQVGKFSAFKAAWFITSTQTQVAVTLENVLGLDAPRAKVYRSVMLVTIDYLSTAPLFRVFYLRKVANAPGDVAYSMSESTLQTLPLNLRAYGDATAANGRFFGYIIQNQGFGGYTVP